MTISRWLDGSHLKKNNYDIVIIGGGIAGLSTAYWLQKNDSNLKIAIIEKSKIGFGASGRNAGFVTCGSVEHFIKLINDFGFEKAAEIWSFSAINHSLLIEEIIQDSTELVDYKRTGSCTIAPNEERLSSYLEIVKQMRSANIEVNAIDTNEIKNDYGLDGFVGGVRYEGDGFIHPIKLLNLIKSKLKVDFFENTEVFKFENKNSVQEIKTDVGTFLCSKIFLTVNAYLPLILPEYSRLVVPGRGQVLMTEPLPAFVRGPCYLTKYLCYFRQLPSGHLLIGGFRNLDVEAETTFVDGVTDRIQSALLEFVKSHFKYGKDAKIAYQWSGVMGFTPDGQMILGKHPINPNIHIMAGCSGHGMGLSFHAAKKNVQHFYGLELPSHLDIKRLGI